MAPAGVSASIAQVTPSGAVTSPVMRVVGSNGSNSWRSLRIGVKRQASSRPVGTVNASGSSEVKRSGGVPDRPLCVCARVAVLT